jgi:hypothetical protein
MRVRRPEITRNNNRAAQPSSVTRAYRPFIHPTVEGAVTSRTSSSPRGALECINPCTSQSLGWCRRYSPLSRFITIKLVTWVTP